MICCIVLVRGPGSEDCWAAVDCHKGRGIVLPGGACEPGETFKECAVRELKEETGLIVPASKLILLHHSMSANGWYTYTFLAARPNRPVKLQRGDGGEPLWATWYQLMQSYYKAYYELVYEAYYERRHRANTGGEDFYVTYFSPRAVYHDCE